MTINNGDSLASVRAQLNGALATIAALGPLAGLTPSGTPSAATFLSGAGAWATPAAGGGSGLSAPPSSGLFAAINPRANHALVTNVSGELVIRQTTPNTGTNLTTWHIPAPPGDFDLLAEAELFAAADTFLSAGIAVVSTASPVSAVLALDYTLGCSLTRWPTPSSVVAVGAARSLRLPSAFLSFRRRGSTLTALAGPTPHNLVQIGNALTVGVDLPTINGLGLAVDSNQVTTENFLVVRGWSVV